MMNFFEILVFFLGVNNLFFNKINNLNNIKD